MGYMIEIEESSAMELKEHAKKALKHMGKLMESVEELCEESQMGERNRYGNRMGFRDDEDEWEDYGDDPYMGERRGRSMRTGRYIRR